jgi:serine phosphatase RsbU (regulator of sigma subunit)
MAARTALPRGRDGSWPLPGYADAKLANWPSRWVQIPVESPIAGDSKPALPWRHGPDLAGLAAFTLDSRGRVDSWPVAAARLFGRPAQAVTGQDLRDVLMTGPGQRELAGEALAEVAAGRVWTATLAMSFAGGGGPVAVRCEPLDGPGSGALVIAWQATQHSGPGWLSEAADRIGTTLDLSATAREVAGVAVPAFADAAAVFVAERLLADDEPAPRQAGPAAVVRRLVARLAGQPAAVTDSLLCPGEVLVFSGDSPSFRAMDTGSPVLFDHLDAETAERIARRPGGRELTSSYASFLAVPLTARGVVLGCMTFGRAARSPDFGPGDIAAAGELASRAAVCIDNARLYDRERRTAFALQRGLLPGDPRVPAGMEAAHRYLPVGARVVGGDWHDIVALPGGRAALIVGDVMGHGPEAAAIMVQLRTAAHTLADLDLPPEEMLGRLDRMAAGMPRAPFATCIAAVIDTSGSSCVITTAGHPPPVLALADGATRVLDLPPGLPLGLGTGSFEATQVSLPPGATLALYTDGLAESRTRPLDDGIAALRDALSSALARPGATLDSTCETVTQALRQRDEDDITLVLARVRP